MVKEAKWVKLWVSNLAVINDRFRDDDGRIDFEALGREEYAFRMALIRKDFSKSERAAEAWNEAQDRWSAASENGRKGGRPKKNREDELKPASVPGAKAFGRFGNVMLTDDQFGEFARKVGNLDKANAIVDSLSASLADGSVKSDNHLATLTKWAQYRADKELSEDRRTPYQKNQDELLALYKATSAKLKENGN